MPLRGGEPYHTSNHGRNEWLPLSAHAPSGCSTIISQCDEIPPCEPVEEPGYSGRRGWVCEFRCYVVGSFLSRNFIGIHVFHQALRNPHHPVKFPILILRKVTSNRPFWPTKKQSYIIMFYRIN